MVVLAAAVDGPYVFLVEGEDGDFAELSDMDEDGVQLGGVVVLSLALLLVVDVDLLLGEVDVSCLGRGVPFSRSTLMTRKIYFLPTFMARWMALRMVVVYSLMGIMPLRPLYSSSAT